MQNDQITAFNLLKVKSDHDSDNDDEPSDAETVDDNVRIVYFFETKRTIEEILKINSNAF